MAYKERPTGEAYGAATPPPPAPAARVEPRPARPRDDAQISEAPPAPAARVEPSAQSTPSAQASPCRRRLNAPCASQATRAAPPAAASAEFLAIPRAIREMRGVSWPAKAVACHLAFRQRGRDRVSIGQRLLARDLGMGTNTVRRALRQAADAGLLVVLPSRSRKRHQYDARPAALPGTLTHADVPAARCSGTAVSDVETVAAAPCLQDGDTAVSKVETVSPPDCIHRGDTTVSTVETVSPPNCIHRGDTTVSTVESRQEVIQELQTPRREREVRTHGDEQDDMQRLLSHSFRSRSPDSKAKAAVVDQAWEAVRRGATMALLAHAVNSKSAEGATPWARIKDAGRRAAELLTDARKTFREPYFERPFKGFALTDLFAWLDACPDEPGGDARRLVETIKAWRGQAVCWPEPVSDAQDATRAGAKPEIRNEKSE